MPISDPSQDRKDHLDDSINELETYIDETEEQTRQDQVPILMEGIDRDVPTLDIPVLDEVVDSSAQPAPPPPAGNAVTELQLLDLIDNLENRLTHVLETLVKTMKDEMIDTISEEVKAQLDSYQQKLDSRDHPDRTSATEPDYSHLDGYRPYGE